MRLITSFLRKHTEIDQKVTPNDQQEITLEQETETQVLYAPPQQIFIISEKP